MNDISAGKILEEDAIETVKLRHSHSNLDLLEEAEERFDNIEKLLDALEGAEGALGIIVPSFRVLDESEYTFDPQGAFIFTEKSAPAQVGLFSIVENSYGNPSQPSTQSGLVSSAYPEAVGVFPHMSTHIGASGQFQAIPTNTEDINSVRFFLQDIIPGVGSHAAWATGVVTDIVQVHTNDGFDTYRLDGTADADFFFGGKNELEFSIYIGALPCKENICSTSLGWSQGMPTSSIHIRHVSGEGQYMVTVIEIDANAATNRFVNGFRNKIQINAEIKPNDRVNLSMSLKTTFSDFAQAPPDTTVVLEHNVSKTGIRQGDSRRTPTIANMSINYGGAMPDERFLVNGAMTALLTSQGIQIDSSVIMDGMDFYELYAAMAGTVTRTVEIHEIEIESRVKL